MRGLVYDGRSARGRPAAVAIEDRILILSFDDGATDRVGMERLTRGARTPERLTVHREDQPDWRLVVTEPELTAALAGLHPLGRFRRTTIALYSGVSAALVAGALGLWLGGDRVLDLVVPLLPHRPLERLGESVVKAMGSDRKCDTQAGEAALGRLLTRLTPPGGFAEPIHVSVADTATINAFAVPGGRVVILHGLIDQAESPDEVAGILAHEITHVQLHHPTKALIRAIGVSTLVQAIGGQTGALMNEAVLLSGSRDAERAADAGALTLLDGAGISPKGLADFFKRMNAKKTSAKKNRGDALIDRLGGFMATHPGNDERLTAIDGAGKSERKTTPAMSDEDWKSLRDICETAGSADE
ncbi:MAG TPA: M48 family metallopeptidase [Alphaproteobacteria bacterium]|nr:M48 family metallopeptidase [Alphaproteobacteria bacterium]